MQFVLKKRSGEAGRIPQDAVVRIDAVLSINKVAQRISSRLRKRSVWIVYGRTGMSFVCQVTPDGAAFTNINRIMVIVVREFHVVLDFQPIEYLDRTFGTKVHGLIIICIVFKQTIVSIETARNVVIQFPIIAADRQVMVLCECVFLIQFTIPVSVPIIGILSVRIDFPFLRDTLFFATFEFF